MEKPIFQGGLQMGYTMGQNGKAWPDPVHDILGNNNRGGFYISQLRVKGTIPFDSTFSGVFVGNVMFLDPQEVYLEKRWDKYRLKAGKIRGAGLKSGSGTDEFERIPINVTSYARYANYYERTFNFRDFGIQLERDGLKGNLQQRLFVHNGTLQNVFNFEPSQNAGPPAQVLGFDYALDWKVFPFTVLGGQIGILADSAWDEFVGHHKGWQAGYWFKSNAIVDASIYHQMDFTRLHILNEALILSNRDLASPVDSTPTQLWGVSSMLRMDHSARWGSFLRYEYIDPSNGYVLEDNLQVFTIGGILHPSPQGYPNLKFTGEYVRTLEEGVRDRIANDLLYVQFQMLF